MSESGIDMERCLRGVDDEAAWIPRITWTNCADVMPPKSACLLVRSSTDKAFPCTGTELHEHKVELCKRYGTNDMFDGYIFQWTPYTPEKWKELNK